MRETKFAKYWLPVIVYAGFIFWLSSLPELPAFAPPIPFFDKFVHTLEYFVFGILLSRAFKNYGFRKITVWVVVVALLYGISDEIHQHFVPIRQPSVLDLVFDCLGAYLGALVVNRRGVTSSK